MAKTYTINVPTHDGIKTQSGVLFRIPLNVGRSDLPADVPTFTFLFVLHENGKPSALTHWESGLRFASLDDIVFRRKRAGLSLGKRVVAEQAVEETVRRVGIETCVNAVSRSTKINDLPV